MYQKWDADKSLGQVPLMSLLNSMLQDSAQHIDKEFNLQKQYLIDCIEISIQLLIHFYLTSFQ